MLISLGVICLLRLTLANYLLIKDFRNGHTLSHVDIIKISHNYCVGPIFNVNSQSLCEKTERIHLTKVSLMHKKIFDILSENQTQSEKSSSCFMVLTRQYQCAIEYQIRNAHYLHFKTIIYITSNETFSQEISDFSDHDLSMLSVIMISLKDGEKLVNITSNRFCYAQMMPSDLSPIVLVTYIFMLGVATFLIYSIFKISRRFNYLWTRIRYMICMKMSLNNLEIENYKPGENDETCSICLIEFSKKTKIRKLVCGHVFHPGCIDHWIRSHRPTCPLCNKTVCIPNLSLRVKCSICASGGRDSIIQLEQESQATVMTIDNNILVTQQEETNQIINTESHELIASESVVDENVTSLHVCNHADSRNNEESLNVFISKRDVTLEETNAIMISNESINDETV